MDDPGQELLALQCPILAGWSRKGSLGKLTAVKGLVPEPHQRIGASVAAALMSVQNGGVIELDVEAGEPLNLVVNGCLIAQGEVVIVDDRYGIRLTDIISPSERLRKSKN